MPHKSIGASGLGDAALSASTQSSSTAASSAAQDTPRSSVATDGQDADDELPQPSDAGDEALSAPAVESADAAAVTADAPSLALVPASAGAPPQQQTQQQQQEQQQAGAAPQQHSFNIWSDTEDVLRQMVAWLAGLETVVCQGRIAAEPAAAARSRSYLSVHKVAALLAGGCCAKYAGSWACCSSRAVGMACRAALTG